MQNSKKFLMRFVKVMFLFNSCLVPGCIFTCQNSVSAHDLTAREFFKDIMNQINSNGGYTGTGMPFGFSNGEECVYIPCANGADIIVPKQITEFISSDFNMYFHNLVLQYSLKSTSPVPAPMPYPTPSSMMPPAPAPVPYPTPSSTAPSYIPTSVDAI